MPYPGPLDIAEAFSVRGQSVVITGACGKIGSGIADAFAANGARVMVSDLDPARLAETAKGIGEEFGAEVAAQPADLRQPDELRALIDAAAARFGGLTTLVNCGAIPHSGRLHEETEADFDRYFQTNVRSFWLLTRYALPHLEKSSGSIVNIASVNGRRALFPCALYSGTKAAMITMTGEMAAEFGEKRVRFNTVSPGLIRGGGKAEGLEHLADTLHPPHSEAVLAAFGEEVRRNVSSSQPLPFRGERYDVAMAVIYLASPAARFVTGADLVVDGGKLHMFEYQHTRHPSDRDFWRRLREFLLALPDSAWKAEKPEWLNRKW